ncbi:helix-turn-helix domain-containing protein [Chryseobacterium sp. RG1]|uniref:Helix-turn-helix domain-containing protein n=1 Tax=Chryseobacterium tagetis TaxID=2801334 RepID=A0ABS8A1A8_9FLAO|nr:helix-turn-helix domain-containing protein [Chryseobacterium tagetis]MCA6067738.1 helix-turn-helix domain-containing protein [Chryseobacterium tagetis]
MEVSLITKEDLQEFRIQLLLDIERIINEKMKFESTSIETNPEWIRSKAVRTFMNISAATLQNLRVTGKIKFKKILGSYYYNLDDLKKLFEHEKR